MSTIFLPERIFFGNDSLNEFSQSRFENILILSDADSLNSREYVERFKNNLLKTIPKIKIISGRDFNSLYGEVMKYLSAENVDRIIAVGGARLIDFTMLISYKSGVSFAAVPFFSSCAMTDFEKADYRTYRKSPAEVILCPDLAMYVDSNTIVYDAFSCFAYAMDTVMSCENDIIRSLAVSSSASILNNIIGAYRGNFKSIQRLQSSMYCAVLSHRNMISLSSSVLDAVTSFFAQLGISKQTSAAICISEIVEYSRSDILCEVAKEAGLFRSDEDASYSIDRLIDRIRKIQASLNIPRCISSICSEKELYSAFSENTHLPSELLDTCFYGSFKFMKL